LTPSVLDVAIIGAGPAGLAAAIAARTRGLKFVCLEKGALVNSLVNYPSEMVFFTTPELMEIGNLPFVSPHEKPTRQEALRYYRRAADRFELDLYLGATVIGLERTPDGPFRLLVASGGNAPSEILAKFVVIATGAYDLPNMLGIPGEDLDHVSHYYDSAHLHYRQSVVIVGGKNSAAEAALEIFRAGGRVTLVHRGPALGDSIKYWVKPDIENRIAEKSIKARFNSRLLEITLEDVLIEGPKGRTRELADAVLLMTGYRSDPTLLRHIGAQTDDETGAAVHDERTFETTVPGVFVIGAAVAGKQSGTIFIENGRFHGEVAINEIASRLA
jgi:thioredoxin reductase (NADPH)